jgi:uncharacterized protein (TIGR02001 family)
MFALRKAGLALGMAGIFAGLATAATAGDSLKDDQGSSGRELSWSFNVGATTDYVFRGVSQSDQHPALQGGIDVTYGSFYIGVWSSMIDFDDAPPAEAEVDFYAGFKPVWRGVTFDLGVIYYAYPGADDPGNAELDYVELKVGASGSPIDKLTIGGTIYYSPEYTFETGNVWTFEGTAAYELRKFGFLTPTVSATLGYQFGEDDAFFTNAAGTDDDFLYWNAGIAFAVEKLTLDFRYWDTDIGSDAGGVCAAEKLCDERFVFSAKFTY